MPGIRTSITRTRYGSSNLAIAPVFLYLIPVATLARVVTLLGREENVTSIITARRTADIVKDDILLDASSRRWLVVQVRREPSSLEARCVEIPAYLIPDEFENQSIEAFWTASASGFSESGLPGMMSLAPPQASFPASAKYLYQTIPANTDFDIWARIVTPDLSAAQAKHALIGARITSNTGVYVGLRNDGDGVLRLDQTGGSAMDEWIASSNSSTSDAFVRLKRVQGAFHTYFKANPVFSGPALQGIEPQSDEDWTELVPAVGAALAAGLASIGAVDVGLFGYENATPDGGSVRWLFVRNWE